MSRTVRLALVSLAIPALSPLSSGAVLFMPLGDLPGGISNSIAYGISADGSRIVGRSHTGVAGTLPFHAFHTDAAGPLVALNTYPGSSSAGSIAWGVDATGSTVVGESDGRAVRWNGSATAELLSVGGLSSVARAASADGSVIVGQNSSSGSKAAFRWTSTGVGFLSDLSTGVNEAGAHDVSANGGIVVGFGTTSAGVQPVRWVGAAAPQHLGSLGGAEGEAKGVSADGTAVVGWSFNASGDREAFLWQESTSSMIGLGDLPTGTFYSSATAVSADASVVVGTSRTLESGTAGAAFVWDAANGMRDLKTVLTDLGIDLTGWTLYEATDISDDGLKISGFGRGPNGTEAWVADLSTVSVPESPPLEIWLTASGALAVAGTFRRRAARQATASP